MVKKVPGRNGGTLHALEKGETANPNGQPKKTIRLVNDELKKEWYEMATRADIESAYVGMVWLPKRRLFELQHDPSQPMLIRIVAKSLLSGGWFDVLERVLDRAIGKAKQPLEHSGGISMETPPEVKEALDKLINSRKWTKKISK